MTPAAAQSRECRKNSDRSCKLSGTRVPVSFAVRNRAVRNRSPIAVIPAKAGIHIPRRLFPRTWTWIPASAGMTAIGGSNDTSIHHPAAPRPGFRYRENGDPAGALGLANDIHGRRRRMFVGLVNTCPMYQRELDCVASSWVPPVGSTIRVRSLALVWLARYLIDRHTVTQARRGARERCPCPPPPAQTLGRVRGSR